MIRHLLKIVWNRRRANALLITEILLSFLVLVGVLTLVFFHADNYRRPLGFSYQDVWNLSLSTNVPSRKDWTPAQAETMRQVIFELRALGPVEAVAGVRNAPYGGSRSNYGYDVGDRRILADVNHVTDDLRAVLGMRVIRGRWFDPSDDGLSWTPVIINERLARDRFGDTDPLGQPLRIPPTDAPPGFPDERVVGLIEDFRMHGEFEAPANVALFRERIDDYGTESLLIKVRPGTTASFERVMLERLQAVARTWSFQVQPLEQARESRLRSRTTPLLAIGLIAGFLLIMVALGLTGVLWQNVTQRTREIGLRRAKGATASRIHRQIVGELMVMATLALIIGAAIVVQFPLLDLVGPVPAPVLASGLVVSMAAIYLLSALCGWYPSRFATRIQPAEALHYE